MFTTCSPERKSVRLPGAIAAALLLAALAFAASLAFAAPLAYADDPDSDAPVITRGEWVSHLVAALEITVENDDEYPENYFSDLDASDPYYLNMLKAVDFGIIDVPAGEAVRPNDPATREFVAQTTNYCLGFQLPEDTAYTYSDSAEAVCKDDLQVAVNRGWFALEGGARLTPRRA